MLPGQQPHAHDGRRRDQCLGGRGCRIPVHGGGGPRRRRRWRRALDLVHADGLVTGISQSAPVVDLRGGIVAGHGGVGERGMEARAGGVGADRGEHPAIEYHRVTAVVIAAFRAVDVQAVAVAVAAARLHVIEIAEQDEIVSALPSDPVAKTVHDVMKLVAVVVDAGRPQVVAIVVVGFLSAHPGTIGGFGSRNDSEVGARGTVRAEGQLRANAEALEIPSDVSGPVGVERASLVLTGRHAVVGKIPAFPEARTGGRSRRRRLVGSCCRDRKEEKNGSSSKGDHPECAVAVVGTLLSRSGCHFSKSGWMDSTESMNK